ncbi:hypothetical protein JL722_3609 [Aureococcus anophagefferens]|nr:hypothetical protein JL722_3609 [Aureococcus anophagefferens]
MADWEVDDDDVEGLEEFDDLYKEDDAEEAVEVAEEAEDAGPRVDISKITSSAERNILSKRNRIWSVHAVLRPRALPHDATDDWSCAQKKELQNFVVHGPRGAGKTAACLAFLRGFAADDGSAKSKRSRGKKAKQQRASGGAYPTLRLSSADAKTAGDLEKKLKAFVREAERVNGEGSTKFVVLDGIDSLTPHAQQGVYHNMISYDKTVGFLFTALNKDRIIDKFAKRCAILPMRRLDKGDALGVFLNVAARERVGYEHRGAVMLFEHAKAGRGELGRAVRSLQRVFAKWEYASYVCKEFAPDAFNAKRKIAAKAALGDPIDRCAVCTLRPPCQHVSEQELATGPRGAAPERDDSIDCTNFVKCGSCRVFNEFGHCSLDHPSTLHCVVLPPHRCPQCTLVWPCQHCSFSGSRNRLIESCTLVAQWVPHYRDDRPTLDVAAKKHESVADVVVDLGARRCRRRPLRVAAAEAFIAGTMCIDEAVYRKRRKEVHDDHDAITSKIGKFLPEQPPLNDDGKFAFPPDPLPPRPRVPPQARREPAGQGRRPEEEGGHPQAATAVNMFYFLQGDFSMERNQIGRQEVVGVVTVSSAAAMLSPRIDPSTLVVHARELRTTRAERHRAWCAKADAESRLASLSAECQKLRRRDVARVKALRSTLRLLEIANEGKVAAERRARAQGRRAQGVGASQVARGARRAGAGRARRESAAPRAAAAAAADDSPEPRGREVRAPPPPTPPRGVGFDAAGTPGRVAGAARAADAVVRGVVAASVGTYSAYGRDPALHTIDDEGDDEPDEEAFGQIEFGARAAASPKPLDATGTLSLEELAGLVI